MHNAHIISCISESKPLHMWINSHLRRIRRISSNEQVAFLHFQLINLNLSLPFWFNIKCLNVKQFHPDIVVRGFWMISIKMSECIIEHTFLIRLNHSHQHVFQCFQTCYCCVSIKIKLSVNYTEGNACSHCPTHIGVAAE